MVDTVAYFNEKRDKILSIIRQRGPCLPVQISREIGLSILFTSALLSELVSEKAIKLSNLKVGGSPLYFMAGQEAMLEKFINYLPSKEREAFTLLKKKSLLNDEKIQPAYRVALRSIKDFAIPMKASGPAGDKIFWRLYSVERDKAVDEIRKLMHKPKAKTIEKTKVERKEEIQEKARDKEERRKEKEEQKNAKIKEVEFVKKVYQYLHDNNIDLLEEKEIKKKNIMLHVKVNSDIGKFDMLIIAKDKKTISDTDLKLALSNGQNSKLSVLLLASGKLSKKALKEIEKFKSYLIFKQLV